MSKVIVVIGAGLISFVLVMMLGDRVHSGEAQGASLSKTQTAIGLLSASQASFSTMIRQSIENSPGGMLTAPNTVAGNVPDTHYCGTSGCAWTAALSGDSGSPNSTVSYATVAGGGASQTDANENTLLNNAGSRAVNRVFYRLTLTGGDGMVIPLIADVMVLAAPDPNVPGSQVTVSVNSVRFDTAAATSASLQFLDNLCGDKTLNCATYTSGVTTTLPRTERGCAAPGTGGTVGSPCSPLGDSSPAPVATGSYTQSVFNNQANPSSPVNP